MPAFYSTNIVCEKGWPAPSQVVDLYARLPFIIGSFAANLFILVVIKLCSQASNQLIAR